jgi:LysM repeat protein
VQIAAGTRPPGRFPHYAAPLALAALVAAVVAVVAASTGGSSRTPVSPSVVQQAPARKLPPFWRVHPGDTYSSIAAKTGLTINQLEAFNPHTDPYSLLPGEHLNLRQPVAPRPKPPGPRYWRVRPGDSFGLIAAKTRISLDTLLHLNPHLKPATLQPGDRVRLRR